MYAIKDLDSQKYYQTPAEASWYDSLGGARLYKSALSAKKKAIEYAGISVSYPGNRNLVVVKVEIKEIKEI